MKEQIFHQVEFVEIAQCCKLLHTKLLLPCRKWNCIVYAMVQMIKTTPKRIIEVCIIRSHIFYDLISELLVLDEHPNLSVN